MRIRVSSTEFEGLSFEERVNKIVDKRLGDPTQFPSEYRSWLPKWIETQNIQLPISQVTGAYLTATDTTNLGGDVHGRIGMVRGGSSPYDFIQMTFDAVYDRWVSSPYPTALDGATFSTTSTTYALQDILPPIPWERLDGANLTPQFRMVTRISNNTVGGTATVTLGFHSIDDGDVLPVAGYTLSSWSIAKTNDTQVAKDSDWQDIPAGVTVKQFLLPATHLKSSSGANTAFITATCLYVRWVNKP